MGDSPTPPDPMTTANAQSKMNRETAASQQELNMVDQNTPYGSLKYSQTGTNPDGTPKFSSDINLSPMGQSLLDQSNNNRLATGGLASKLLGSNSGALSGNPLDLGPGLDLGWSATEGKINELNRHTLDPQWQHNTDSQEQKLYNRGVRPGSEAYDNEMRNFNIGKNNAYDQMYLSGHGAAVSDLMNQHNSNVADKTAMYNSPLQTYSTLMTGSQPQNPDFRATPQAGVSPVNYAGMVQQNYDDQMKNSSAQMGGLFGLGGAVGGAAMQYGLPLLMASDRRLKKNIERVGTGARGLPIYEFEYVWGGGRRAGYMADEVEEVAPEAVGELHGFKIVDYARV